MGLGDEVVGEGGVKPRCGSIASQTYLYPAAARAGVLQAVEERDKDGKLLRTRYFDCSDNPIKRWGWHNLRHSLASWLVSNDVDVKTVSSMLRHSNVKTTLAIYSHAVDSKKLAAQGVGVADAGDGGVVGVRFVGGVVDILCLRNLEIFS